MDSLLCLRHGVTVLQQVIVIVLRCFFLIWVKISLPVVVLGPEQLPLLSCSLGGRHSLPSQICISLHRPARVELLPSPQARAHCSLGGRMNKICKAIGAGARKILLTAPRGAPNLIDSGCVCSRPTIVFRLILAE